MKLYHKIARNRQLYLFYWLNGLFIGLLYSHNCLAQQSISIDEAINIGLKNNLQIQLNDLQIDKATYQTKAAKNMPKTGFFIENEDLRPDNSEGILKIGIAQSFEFPTVYGARKKVAVEQQKLSQVQKAQTISELKQYIRSTYYQLWYEQDRQKLLLQLDSIYANLHKIADVRQRAGEDNKLAVIAANAKSKEIKVWLQQNQRDISIQQQTLSQLLNDNILYLAPNTKLEKVNMATNSSSTHPIVQQQTQHIAVANAQLQLQKQQNLPDFTGRVFHQGLYGKDNPFQGYSLTVGVPLFWANSKNKIKVAKTEIDLQTKQLEQTQQALNTQKLQGQNELAKAENALQFYETIGLQQADAIIEAATQSYKAGESGFADLLQYLSQAVELKTNHLTYLNNYNQALIQLLFINNQ